MNNSLLTLITFIPLVGAILMLLPWGKWLSLDKAREERLIKNGAIVISLLPLGLSIVLWFGYNQAAGGFQFQVERALDPGAQHQLPHGRGWAERAADLPDHLPDHAGPVVFVARRSRSGCASSSSCSCCSKWACSGVFISLDLVLFYVFWEVGLVPMYFLIGIWGQAKDRPQYSAIKFFLYTLAGSVFMLLAILGIYFTTGTLRHRRGRQAAAVRRQRPAVQPGLLGLLHRLRHQGAELAVPHLAARRPHRRAHGRLGDPGRRPAEAGRLRHPAHRSCRSSPRPSSATRWSIVALGVISIIYGALVSMAQWDLKRLIAYSSVSHMGYVLLGVGAAAYAIGTPRLGRCQRDGAERRGAADVQPRHHHRRLVLPGRRDLRAGAPARPEDVRRVEQQAALLLRPVRGHGLHLAGPARPGRLLERVLRLPGRLRHRAASGPPSASSASC